MVTNSITTDYDPIHSRIPAATFSDRVAQGKVKGASTWNKFGYNDTISTGTPQMLAEFGGTFVQNIGTAETLSIVSDDAADTSAGTGLRTVVIFGVDDDWNEITDVVAMNGVTPVTSNLSFLGINRMTIYQSGTALSNVGTITATTSGGGVTMATMPAGKGTTQQCFFYVPAGETFLTTWLYFDAIKSSGGGNPEVTFYGYIYSSLVDSQFEIYEDTVDTSVGDHLQLKPAEPFVVTEKSIIWFEVSSTSNNTSVRGRFSGKLLRN